MKTSYDLDEKKKDEDFDLFGPDDSADSSSSIKELYGSSNTSVQNDSANEANEIKPNNHLNSSVKEVTADESRRSKSPPPPPPPPSGESTNENDKLDEKTKILEAVNDAAQIKLQIINQIKTLPWKPKVRITELDTFLDQERKKFFGYGDLPNDLSTLIGLPYPIHESVRILRQHLYVSLSEEQIKLEERIDKYPLSMKGQCEKDDELNEQNPAEIFFSNVLHNLPQYLVFENLFYPFNI
jgi:hypothetical protein